ncbi:MAG: hypothetical protein NZT92_19140 [Abditibacteriales bacterium]|nr:hypothetical protein [Abditibacteriales bacterium]MDW8367717.1 hypothetical protein [Abditibacteriales bacterium]
MTRTQFACVFFALAWAGAAWSQSALKMNVMAGFDGHAKPGRWMPVTVTMDNQGTSIEGTLTLRLASDYRVTQFYTPVSLPNVSRKRFFLYALAEDADRNEVWLDVRGTRPVPLNLHLDNESDQLILVVNSEGEGGLSYIAGLRGVGRPPLSSRYYYAGPNVPTQTSVAHVLYAKPYELPPKWLGYDTLDVVVLLNFSPRDFSKERIQALRTWVAGGGTLVVTGGFAWQRLTERWLADMLPVKVVGSRDLPTAAQIKARYGAGLWSDAPLVVSVGAPLRGRVVVEENGIPLIAVSPFGAGHVIYLAFDPTKPPVAGWEGSAPLWRDILTWAGVRPVLLNASEDDEWQQPPPFYGGRYAYQQVSSSLSAALMNIPSMQSPPFEFIGMFLLFYILCLVPLNYFVLKKINRREWAWVTTPLIVAVFTLLSYGVGFTIKGKTLRVNKLTIVQSQAGEAFGAADTLFGVFSPSKTSYTLATADGEGAVSDLPLEPYSTEPSAMNVREDSHLMLEDYPINMWAMKLFRARSVVNLGGGITAQFQSGDGVVKATVRNRTPYNFAAAVVIVGQQAASLNRLDAGGTATAQVPLTSRMGFDLSQQVINIFGMAPGGDQQRNLRSAALNALLRHESSVKGMDLLAQGALFIGWTAQEALAINIVGHKPQVERGTLVVVRLPLELASAPTTAADALVTGRIVASNLENLVQSSQRPRAVQLEQNQEIVYEFRLPLRANVGSVWVWAQFTGPLRFSAYDFAQRNFHPLSIKASGETDRLTPVRRYLLLPDGIVRVRVQARGTAHLSALKVGFRSQTR